jgi:hypothetical protein
MATFMLTREGKQVAHEILLLSRTRSCVDADHRRRSLMNVKTTEQWTVQAGASSVVPRQQDQASVLTVCG